MAGTGRRWQAKNLVTKNGYSMWWSYYNLKKEPFLSQDPLNSDEELNLFYGREDEIRRINILLEGRLLVSRDTFKTGVPQIYSITELGRLVIEI